MPAVLGLRGSGDFSSDERPKNWREMILYLFPNGEAPLTAMLSLLKSEATTDAEFNWWEKRLPTQRMQVNGALSAGETTIVVDSGAKDAVKGTVILVESTSELLLVSSDPANDTQIPVTRSYGAVPITNIADDAMLVIIGNVHAEGEGVPTAKTYAPTKKFNYTQIFRMPLYLTRTARRTKLRWDSQGPYREAKREALSLHSIEMEKSFIWGEAIEDVGANGKPRRMTGGILSFITTNKGGTLFNQAGTLTIAELEQICEAIFRYGKNEKLVLCGSTFLSAVTTLARTDGTINLTPASKDYGLKITEWRSPFGSLMFKLHPLFNQHPEWRKNALVLDVSNLKYRYVDDTMFIKNRQDPGLDASMDEFLTECGLEVNMEETHAYITGVTGAA